MTNDAAPATENPGTGDQGHLCQPEDGLRVALDVRESVFEAAPAGIYTCDAQGLITSFNQAAADLWGRRPEIGDSDQRFCGSFRLYWPDGRLMPHSETPMAAAVREGRPCKNGEVVIERPDGSRITAMVNIVPIRDSRGELIGAVNCFVDITARKQVEAMLRQRTMEYRRLLENLPAAAYTCDAEGLITYFNPQAAQVWGREPELNHPVDRYCGSFRLFLPDGSPITHDQCWMALALQTGQPQHGREIIIERPDGSRATALAHAHPFHNEEGKLIGAVNVLVDITHRKQAEAAQARLAAIVASAEDAIISKDLQGVITSWNRGAQNLFGYTAEEAIGRSVTMLMPPDRLDEEAEILGRIRRGETIENYETVRRRKFGELLDISLTVSPIVDAQGRIVGVSKIARDITGRKRSEALLETQQRLLEMVATGTALPDVLNALHQVMEDHCQGTHCSINVVDQGGQRFCAGPSSPLLAGCIGTINGMPVTPPYPAPCARAAHLGAPVVVSNIASDRQWSDEWRRLALDHGLRTCRSIPIIGSSGKVLGTVDLYSTEPGSPALTHSPLHERLIEVATHVAGIALERHQTEQGLALYREVIAHSTEAIAIIDLQGHYLEQNAAHQALTGYSDEELRGRTPAIHLGDEAFAAIARELQEQGSYQGEVVSRRKDGSRADIALTAFPVRGAGGRPVCYVGIKRDVTERKRMEDALRKSEGELTDFIETATLGIHRVGSDGIIQWANEAELQILGYAPDEYIGHHIGEFHADQEVLATLLSRLHQGEHVRDFEAALRARDGSLRNVLIDSNVYWENGEFKYTRCFTRDITERKRAAEALREADRRKDEFLAMLSHELRNPLAPISNALQLLDSPQNDGCQQMVVDLLKRQVGTLSRLVNDLMDVSRVTTGRIQLQNGHVDLGDLVRCAADSFQPIMAERRHQFSVSLPGAPLWVYGDATRLEQVVVNLLSNAAKYTPQGGKIWLTLTAVGDEAVLRVRDTGVGIEPGLLPSVFDLFTQGAAGLDRTQSGLGIGLALVRRLVDMHAGTVTARSEGPGKGSEFVMRLPAAGVPGEEHRRPTHGDGSGPRPVPENEGCDQRGMRVLLVDDSRDAVDLQSLILRRYGYEVETALDGPTALEVARDFRPDAVVLDIGLPGMNGYEVAERLRREEALRDVVLIAMTGYSHSEAVERAREAGFDHHLVKPVQIEELQRVLESDR